MKSAATWNGFVGLKTLQLGFKDDFSGNCNQFFGSFAQQYALVKVSGSRIFESTRHRVTVTTRSIISLVGDPRKPSFATVSGWGVDVTKMEKKKKKNLLPHQYQTPWKINGTQSHGGLVQMIFLFKTGDV